MGSPRDITSNLTRWTGRSPKVGGELEPEEKPTRPARSAKKKVVSASAEQCSTLPTRSTDYFAVFVYSLLGVSLLSQLVIMLTLSVF